MRESWRWFGPGDPVTLADIRQTGATEVVSALHDIPTGEVWPVKDIRSHKALIESGQDRGTPLRWSVVESIPVHEDIKLAKPTCQIYIDNWIESMENLASFGIRTICYNFMPVIDWTRTDLRYQLPSGAYALRFDQARVAVFDLFILKRDNAADDYSAQEILEARKLFMAMPLAEQERLSNNIIAGLPGKMTNSYTLEDFRKALAEYKDVSHATLRGSLMAFLAQVLPVAEKLGVKLAIHPDDPPRDLLGLPRVICTADDLTELFDCMPNPANGMTFCVGTYGSRADNDLPQMARRFGSRIHFAHLRGVNRDAREQRSFTEADHLGSDIDMVQVIAELLTEEQRRLTSQSDLPADIFLRPDHGHQMMDDIDKTVNPGYSAIGRLKGLAEIRGVIQALSATLPPLKTAALDS